MRGIRRRPKTKKGKELRMNAKRSRFPEIHHVLQTIGDYRFEFGVWRLKFPNSIQTGRQSIAPSPATRGAGEGWGGGANEERPAPNFEVRTSHGLCLPILDGRRIPEILKIRLPGPTAIEARKTMAAAGTVSPFHNPLRTRPPVPYRRSGSRGEEAEGAFKLMAMLPVSVLNDNAFSKPPS